MEPIFFWTDEASEPHGFLCQWYRSEFEVEGVKFNCAEQWMMWRKAGVFEDSGTAKRVLATTSPRKQKQLGREVEGFNGEIWDQHKFDVVVEGNYYKFTQSVTTLAESNNENDSVRRPLKELLLATGDQDLIEASPYDRVWGIGFSAADAKTHTDRKAWGENLLGKALMEVRARLRKEEEQDGGD